MSKSIREADTTGNTFIYRYNGNDYTFYRRLLEIDSLLFWTSNPRTNIQNPPQGQKEFFELFKCQKNVTVLHAKLLLQPQQDPLFVKEVSANKFIVYEGNSRLAAMKLIHEEFPLKFQQPICWLAPKNCPDQVLEAIVDERHGEDPPVAPWKPFGRALFYHTLFKRYKSLKTVSKIVGDDVQEVSLFIKTFQILIKNAKDGEPDPDRWSAVLEVNKRFQRKTSFERSKVYNELINTAVHDNYGGFNSAGKFRDALKKLKTLKPNEIRKHRKNSELPELANEEHKEKEVKTSTKIEKKRTPHLIRRIKKAMSGIRSIKNDIDYKKKNTSLDSNRKNIKSWLVRLKHELGQLIKSI